jgi:opacity protein-like surface antigen
MKLRSSIVAIAALSSMSFAGGDIGGVVELENKYDYVPAQAVAEVEYVEPTIEYVAPPAQEYVAPPAQEYVAPPTQEYVAPPAPYVAPAPTPAPYVAPAPTPAPYVAPMPTPAPPVVVPTPKPTPKPVQVAKPSGPSGLYVGGALTEMASRSNCEGNRANVFSAESGQDRQQGFTGILGYDFMDYLGAELRASIGLAGDDYGTKMKQFGAYLKPNIDLGDALNLYGLLGYSTVNMSDCGRGADLDNTNSGLSYGAGINYGVTENISVFTDIVNYLRDDETRSTWGANLGVKYKF